MCVCGEGFGSRFISVSREANGGEGETTAKEHLLFIFAAHVLSCVLWSEKRVRVRVKGEAVVCVRETCLSVSLVLCMCLLPNFSIASPGTPCVSPFALLPPLLGSWFEERTSYGCWWSACTPLSSRLLIQ